MNTINLGLSRRRSCTLVHEYFVKQLKSKVSDTVLCLGGKCQEYPQCAKAWESRFKYFISTSHFRDLDNIDGEPVVIKWKIFSGHTTLALLRGIQVLMEKELDVQPHRLSARSPFWVRNDLLPGHRRSRCFTHISSNARMWRAQTLADRSSRQPQRQTRHTNPSHTPRRPISLHRCPPSLSRGHVRQ